MKCEASIGIARGVQMSPGLESQADLLSLWA